jgi:hypothetical protein
MSFQVCALAVMPLVSSSGIDRPSPGPATRVAKSSGAMIILIMRMKSWLKGRMLSDQSGWNWLTYRQFRCQALVRAGLIQGGSSVAAPNHVPTGARASRPQSSKSIATGDGRFDIVTIKLRDVMNGIIPSSCAGADLSAFPFGGGGAVGRPHPLQLCAGFHLQRLGSGTRAALRRRTAADGAVDADHGDPPADANRR